MGTGLKSNSVAGCWCCAAQVAVTNAQLTWELTALGGPARYLGLAVPVAEGLPLQANPGTRWSQAAPLLHDLCFLKAKARQHLHHISPNYSTKTPGTK